jgi:hypothetical protein
MIQYAIYFNPNDTRAVPHPYTVQPLLIADGKVWRGDHWTIYETIEEAREAIPEGMVKFIPSPMDDPCLVETWI